jgi:cytochrome c553
MNTRNLIALMIVAGLGAGCTNLPRSRDLANPDVAGQTLAEQVCSNCHGVTGDSISPNFPNLAAQQEVYLTTQLTSFRSHSRRDPPGYEYMWGISRSLSDKQVHELAVYFSAQHLRARHTEGDAAQIDAGHAIFTSGIAAKGIPPCGSCHGPEAMGNDKYPRLAGQHANYIVKQLTVFQRTDERPEGALMKVVAHELSAADITNVAAYLQSMGAH